ncbi:MAG: AAA family ATPase [Lachnospiraceae bacterium]|nr:AAA family ATPase [Candidatus Minthocola equi]
MTLKELRIEKGLSQSECAEYLGMTTRNYQNYENIPAKAGTAKYHSVYNRLSAYRQALYMHEPAASYSAYNTSVVLGDNLKALTERVTGYEKRRCFNTLRHYIHSANDGRIAILYGLRRTGKTTLLFQMIQELPFEKTAYIKIKTTDNMSGLVKDLEALYKNGFTYIFIDEVTLMDDFIGTAALLSDIFATMGMKIVVSGTDSLGFAMAGSDELYDRHLMIHTSFIPFAEYSRLLGITSVDSYIEYGGTLRMENMGFGDPELTRDEVSFRDDESTRKYIDSSISRNIQHTLRNVRFGEAFYQLRELYDKGELTNAINRIIESMNHRFLLSVVEERFISHDLGSARQLLLHDYPDSAAHVLYDVNEREVTERLKALIDIKEKAELAVPVTQEHIDKIKSYLYKLDLIDDCSERYETGSMQYHTVFTQPGMRYSIAKALVYSLMQDEYFATRSESDKTYIAGKILEDVKGRMLEDIVLFETSHAGRNGDVFKFKFDDGGEIDMVVYSRGTNTCRLYEIKHSDKSDKNQSKYLRDEARLALIKQRFGEISDRCVIYRGKSKTAGDIKYINVEEYLKGLL